MKKTNKIKSIYIHIPFCSYLCHYCDFTKLQYFSSLAKDYLINLKKELDSYNIKKDDIKTIYVGGGTPTVLEDDLFLSLLEMIKPYTKNVEEYTFEANPESLTLTKIKIMKAFGVNRLSIGVESSDDNILKAINRHHTFNDVITAVTNARKEGITNINLDLILGLPNVSETMLEKDLNNILSLKPTHISCYSLSVNPHTMFYIKNIKPIDDDVARNYYDIVEEKLLKSGYIHYEISNFAKSGYESKHNYTYWKDEPYYGVGLSAAGYIDNIRYKNTSSITSYNKGHYLFEKEIVTLKDDIYYFTFLNLRTKRGLIFEEFKAKLGFSFIDNIKIQKMMKEHESRGLIVINKTGIYPTYEGMMVEDSLALDYINILIK